MFEGFDFGAIFTAAGLAKLGQIIIGDLTMAGDNIVIMGSLSSGLPEKDPTAGQALTRTTYSSNRRSRCSSWSAAACP